MTYDNWAAIVRPIGDRMPIAWVFFLLWIAIAAVGLLNLLTAVFIDALTDLNKQAVEAKRVANQERRLKATSLSYSLAYLLTHSAFSEGKREGSI